MDNYAGTMSTTSKMAGENRVESDMMDYYDNKRKQLRT
jgi:hypothetical protein